MARSGFVRRLRSTLSEMRTLMYVNMAKFSFAQMKLCGRNAKLQMTPSEPKDIMRIIF
ncbi:hypothetical protein BN1007_71048 [Klebsiella variicola]|nr:hypothetical protein BN1007_71048 [Klebsiella variicola]